MANDHITQPDVFPIGDAAGSAHEQQESQRAKSHRHASRGDGGGDFAFGAARETSHHYIVGANPSKHIVVVIDVALGKRGRVSLVKHGHSGRQFTRQWTDPANGVILRRKSTAVTHDSNLSPTNVNPTTAQVSK
jgi:hypothetical protein